MKLNNKGVTLVEIIVSVTLISIVIVFMFRLLVILKEIDDKSLSKIEYEEKTSLIMKTIQDEIKDTANCKFSRNNDNTTLTIECDENTIVFSISEKSVSINLQGDTKTYKFPNNTEINKIQDNSNSSLYKYNIDIKDDKDNVYPIEIVYLKQS